AVQRRSRAHALPCEPPPQPFDASRADRWWTRSGSARWRFLLRVRVEMLDGQAPCLLRRVLFVDLGFTRIVEAPHHSWKYLYCMRAATGGGRLLELLHTRCGGRILTRENGQRCSRDPPYGFAR